MGAETESRNQIGLGLIGYGGFGKFLRKCWSSVDEVEIRAVSDVNPDADDGAVMFYADWRALLSDPAVQLVSIATPPSSHADMACAAMRAGKHVLIEKPLATTRADAVRIQKVQRETGCVAAIDYLLRFNPVVEAMHAWSASSPFGPLRRVTVENYAQDESLPNSHWFWDKDVSGGILVEHAVHFIDVVNGCTSSAPVRIRGDAVRRDKHLTDRMLLSVRYADGLLMSQYHAFSRPGFFEETTLRFVFDLAQVEVRGWIPLEGSVRALVDRRDDDALGQLPNLDIIQSTPLTEVGDDSRPDGWGVADSTPSRHQVQSGGQMYEVTDRIDARFSLNISKSDAYANALCALLKDVVAAIRSPDHRLRVTLDDGAASLDTALIASADAWHSES